MNDPPIFEFQQLKPITMTVTSVLNTKELDLSAIFCFIPVTNQKLPMNNFRRKQGKIQLPPELNKPGEIISMRWNGSVRGIVRSDNPKFFPHSIIMDFGTSSKIVSYKLGKTIEVTGATSLALVQEASDLIFRLIRICQGQLECIRACPQLNTQIQSLFLYYFSQGVSPIPDLEANGILFQLVAEWLQNGTLSELTEEQVENCNQYATAIWRFYYPHFYYPTESCLESMFKGVESYRGNLYEGDLSLGKLDSHMVNIAFTLGYTINQSKLQQAMNRPPFEVKFVNIKNSSPVKILFHYKKIEKSTGKIVNSKQTITVNKGGYVKMSGPTLAAMEPVYYTFLKSTIENYEEIRSFEEVKSSKIKVGGSGEPVSIEQIQRLFTDRMTLKKKIFAGNVPLIDLDAQSEDAVVDFSEPAPTPNYRVSENRVSENRVSENKVSENRVKTSFAEVPIQESFHPMITLPPLQESGLMTPLDLQTLSNWSNYSYQPVVSTN